MPITLGRASGGDGDDDTSVGNRLSKKLTLFGMVGAVMTALHLKSRFDEYQELPRGDDEENRVALLRGEDDVSMHDTQIPGAIRPKRTKRRGCCMCCGIDCTLFWKAFGIVFLGFALWYGFKLFRWATTPTPTGLENMPEYSTSLGCTAAEHLYEGGKVTYTVPVGPTSEKPTHQLNVKGAAVGTILIAEASSDATDITMEMTLRSDDETLFDDIKTHFTDPESEGKWTTTIITTPASVHNACMRFDIVLYIPSTLKTLSIDAHALAQIKFDPNAELYLDSLLIQTYGLDERAMVLSTEGIKANHLEINSYRGWLVGDMAIVNETVIITKKGPVYTNVHFHPTVPLDLDNPEPVHLTTRTDRGRTDLFFENHNDEDTNPHRPIVAQHLSGRMMGMGGDLYLTYKNAEFNGRVDLKAKSHTAYNLEGTVLRQDQPIGMLPYHGNPGGGDSLWVRAPMGWVGLYF